MENIKYLEKVHNIANIMNWKIVDVHKKLEINFNQQESFDFPNLDTFRKQYSKTGKGSKKNFKVYFEYLYSLKEVQNKLIEPKKQNIIGSIFIILFLVVFLFVEYDPHHKYEILKSKDFKLCVKQCAKDNSEYIEQSTSILDSFTFIRVFTSNKTERL